ncbi:eCIS core domain-containing protein [Nocardia gipuzkoensis]|uniref:eCIS core domain-containing protein n=1 Tax=Nocardia gipuzkoensis TaxID=2749991 RepID=UPI003EE22298
MRRSASGVCTSCRCGGGCGGDSADAHVDLDISDPGDPDEIEADRIADRVVRQDGDGYEEMDGGAGLTGGGSGQALPRPVRRRMEKAFGADFTAVRLHTDAGAATMSRQLAARAFTVGNDIFFGQGEWDAISAAGRRLLAHELVHTMQQSDARVSRLRRLSITRSRPLHTATCGGYGVGWRFGLDKPAAGDGYFVQHVRRYDKVATCPSAVSAVPAKPSPEFWEAWFVGKGGGVAQQSSEDTHDRSGRKSQPDTSGRVISEGTVKFYLRATTGDLGRLDADPVTPNGGWQIRNPATPAGRLPSTTIAPPWWSSRPTEGPADRWAMSWWNCCPAAEKPFNMSDANP